MGWVVDRFEVNQVIAAGFLVWSLATAATGLVRGFTMLLLMRLILGLGESVAFPSCSKILALHVAEPDRGFANGVIIAGMKSGPAVGALGAGLLMERYGWRPVFIGIGLVSLLWLAAWKKWMPRGPALLKAEGRRRCGGSYRGPHPAPAFLLGGLRGPLLRQLPFVFHGHVASVLSGARTPAFSPLHGRNRKCVLPGGCRFSDRDRLVLGLLDTPRPSHLPGFANRRC